MLNLDETIERVHRELDEIRQVKKCATCDCFVDVLEMMKGDLDGIRAPQAEAMLADVQRWLEKGEKKRHSCLGCEICLPTEPYNRLTALLYSREHRPVEAGADESRAPAPCSCVDT